MNNGCLSYQNIFLSESDILTFNEGEQLNDMSISFYFQILSERYQNLNFISIDPATSFLITFEEDLEDLCCMLKPLKLKEKDYIFIPVNDVKSKFKVGNIIILFRM
mgnify:CR=1 FL=1